MGAEVAHGAGGDAEIVFEMGVEIVELGVAHHAGDDGDFFVGVLQQPLGLQHPVGGQVVGEFHAGVLQEDPADVLAAHVEGLRDPGQGLGAAAVALDDEDDLVGDLG